MSLVGRNTGASAVCSHPHLHLHLQRRGTLPGGWSPAPTGGDGGRLASARLMAGQRDGFCPSEGRGRRVKRGPGQALLQGSHPAAPPSNARPGSEPLPSRLIRRQSKQKFSSLCRGLFDYRSQSWDAETPPLASTRTQFRGLCKDPSIPLRKPCALSLR